MTRKQWKKKIKEATLQVGTYRPAFDAVIDTLAGILEVRDTAQAQYEASGCLAVVEHTNQGGNTNTVKNPALVLLMDCNSQALSYWKELGLTASSLKKITEKGIGQGKEPSALEKALARLA